MRFLKEKSRLSPSGVMAHTLLARASALPGPELKMNDRQMMAVRHKLGAAKIHTWAANRHSLALYLRTMA